MGELTKRKTQEIYMARRDVSFHSHPAKCLLSIITVIESTKHLLDDCRYE
jgi:hypothetical protein